MATDVSLNMFELLGMEMVKVIVLLKAFKYNWIKENLKRHYLIICFIMVLLAPVDPPVDGLHLPEHGQQQRGFPTTHLAHNHGQLT